MTPNPPRDTKLCSLAIAFDYDTSDVEDICQKNGLNYDESPIADIEKAVRQEFLKDNYSDTSSWRRRN